MPKWIIAYVSVDLTLLVLGGEDQHIGDEAPFFEAFTLYTKMDP